MTSILSIPTGAAFRLPGVKAVFVKTRDDGTYVALGSYGGHNVRFRGTAGTEVIEVNGADLAAAITTVRLTWAGALVS